MGDVRQGTRAAVIGSGFGGLAVAVRLQAMGVQTVLYEARDKPGGRAYVYEDQGFTFDAGPTVITAPDCIEELFTLAGRSMADYVELLPVTPFYRLLWSDGDSFDYVNDDDALKAQIAARNPKDVAGYERFLAYSRSAYDAGYTERVATPFLRFRDMLRAAPALARVKAHKSVYDAVAGFIEDEHLRQAFSFHALLIGGNPMEISALYSLIHYLERAGGVFFAKGGTGALVQALVTLFEDLGGTVRLGSPVEQVMVQGPRHVVRSGGDHAGTETFDLVVSNADLHHTYGRLYDPHPKARKVRKRLEKMDWSMSLYVLYFGTDRTYDDIAHHTVVFGPRYEGLLTDIFEGGRLAEDFSLYLHAPTRTDPSMAPEGCEAFYVLSPVPHLGHARLDWDTLGAEYGDRILESLERRMLPGLREHIVTRRHFTPLDFERVLGAYHGSAFSVAPVLTQSAWMRPHNRAPGIPGLYIVGAGTHPGAGVPGVINSAKATAGVIARDLRA